jgi:hypothetical protein
MTTNRPDDRVSVAKVRTGIEAARIIAMLAARGIEGATAEVDSTAAAGQFGAVQVMVRRIDVERVELALAQARGDRVASFDFSVAEETREDEPPPSHVRRPGWHRNTTTTGVVILALCVAAIVTCQLTIKYIPKTFGIITGTSAAIGALLVLSGMGAGPVAVRAGSDDED